LERVAGFGIIVPRLTNSAHLVDRGAPLVLNGRMKSALGGFGVVSNGGKGDGVVMLICIEA
jgi:hypothetical protein